MTDPRNKLQSRFVQQNRFNNFGNILEKLRIFSFRCHNDLIVEIESPITVFCGLNGTGKSTILQLSSCAYSGQKTSYIKDYMVKGKLDPNPFTEKSFLEFQYCNDNSYPKSLKITRIELDKRWYYPRRPPREIFFAGIGFYLPKSEKRDFTIRNADKILFGNVTNVSIEAKK
jgi:hypothetical protein